MEAAKRFVERELEIRSISKANFVRGLLVGFGILLILILVIVIAASISNSKSENDASGHKTAKFRKQGNSSISLPSSTIGSTTTTTTTTESRTVITTTTTLVSVQGEDCWPGWIKILERCFYMGCDNRDYDDAKTGCIVMGGKLFEPQNEALNDAVAEKGCGDFFWIGVHDKDREDKFVYDSTNVKVNYTKWGPGEPSDSHLTGEDCVHAYRDSGFWNDLHCTMDYLQYVCQQR